MVVSFLNTLSGLCRFFCAKAGKIVLNQTGVYFFIGKSSLMLYIWRIGTPNLAFVRIE